MTYKADGSVNKIIDAATAQSATLTIDATDLTTKIAGSNGAIAIFTPNTRGQLVKATTPGGTTDYSIDPRGLINEVRFSDGRWIRYTYNASQRIIRITDNTGLVEQYAGLEPRWFIDGARVRTAAAWLHRNGARLGNPFIPEARAQTALVVPVGIVLGLFAIAENSRRNGGNGASNDRCCGREGSSGDSSGGDPGKPSWLRHIATMLADQTALPTATPVPAYDKAGLLISPLACMKAPGNCDRINTSNCRTM